MTYADWIKLSLHGEQWRKFAHDQDHFYHTVRIIYLSHHWKPYQLTILDDEVLGRFATLDEAITVVNALLFDGWDHVVL